jgi:predicted RNA-binding protein YlxR (DUF448 family)
MPEILHRIPQPPEKHWPVQIFCFRKKDWFYGKVERVMRCLKKPKSFEQLNLFTETICTAYLEACDSPKKAFYRIWIEDTEGTIRIVKESGIRGRVLDRSCWLCGNREEAEKAYQRRIAQKINPERSSPRKYRLIRQFANHQGRILHFSP